MTYKIVVCELNLLRKSIIPSMKAVFTKKYVFLFWVLLLIPYYILTWFVSSFAGTIYIIILFIFLIYLLHDICINPLFYRNSIK